MAKYCPVIGQRVVYLTCLECEDKVCMKPSTPVEKPDNKVNNNDENNKQEPQDTSSVDCKKCCHNCSISEEKIGSEVHLVSRCNVFRNYLLNYEKIKQTGCEHFNKDYSKEKICMNCTHYLGGGDWGLACSVHYHRLPSPLDQACASFDSRPAE